MDDRRPGRRRAAAACGIPIPIGGGRGGIIGIVVAVLVALLGGGFGLNATTNGGEGGGQADNTSLEQKCARDNADRSTQLDCRNALYVNSIQAYWQNGAAARASAEQYQPTDTDFFSRPSTPAAGRPTRASARSTAPPTTRSTST